ncbi:zonular occludens toxin domain-containing protein [Pseudomonas aeruginosa]|nr:zonular occludens toxin domain-containing protein [Pseudomonas aeruginosa]
MPALKDGRVIITNVRGFTLERAYQVFRTCPTLRRSSTSIRIAGRPRQDAHLASAAPAGRVPDLRRNSAAFPKSWREKDLEKFDFPAVPEAAHAADRPMGWLDAWTRHRHLNRDIVPTPRTSATSATTSA